jgi:beta-glucosidase
LPISNTMQHTLRTLLFCLLGTSVFAQMPFQNPDLPTEVRVKDLIARMTLREKADQLFNQAEAIPRLGVPAYNWWNEALHGVARAGKATVFPQAIGLAATFDEPLMFNIATAISDEARAKHHAFLKADVRSIYTGLTFWSPNINIFRDPRWGRGQETYGEDPFLTGRMAVNFIRGLQGNDPKYLKTVATAKHYAVHSGPEFTRHIDNIFINDRDLHTTYLPAFKMAVREADVQSVMCAYNRFRDQPCCGSDLLLSNLLRNDFGFKGYVVSDCGAITDFYKVGNHNIVQQPAQAWGWAAAAGTDLNCEESKAFIENHLDSAVATGIINERDLDVALTRLFTARFKLGMFDPEERVPFSKIPYSVVGSVQHQALALEAAEKSLVLLKNEGILPLKKVKKVALIGPNANNFSVLIGNYNGDPIQPVTPLDALRERLGEANVFYTQGCPIVPGIYADPGIVPANVLFHEENGQLKPGLLAEYWNQPAYEGQPDVRRTEATIDYYWDKSPMDGTQKDEFAVRWTGYIIPAKSGAYIFSGSNYTEIFVDGQPAGIAPFALQQGQRHRIEMRLVVKPFWWGNTVAPQARMFWVEDRDYTADALAAARQADVVIFCGGISPNLEGEEMPLKTEGFEHGDRTNINLPAVQENLLKALQNTRKPIVYVNFSGSAIALNWQQANLPAVVQAFYPGEPTGTALTRLLFGDINPSGRLPITFYKGINDLPPFLDYRMEGRTYRYFKGEVLYPFGYGLSYTTFKYSNATVPTLATAGEEVQVSVQVTNTGQRDGAEVVQLYVSAQSAKVPVPIRSLAGFKRVFLKAGTSQTVTFTLTPTHLSYINAQFERVSEAGTFRIEMGGGQQGGTNSTLQLSGAPVLIR